MGETEKSIIVSQSLDNEVEELCRARDFARAMVVDSPKGSCDYRIFKSQLAGINDRLEELGINDVVG